MCLDRYMVISLPAAAVPVCMCTSTRQGMAGGRRTWAAALRPSASLARALRCKCSTLCSAACSRSALTCCTLNVLIKGCQQEGKTSERLAASVKRGTVYYDDVSEREANDCNMIGPEAWIWSRNQYTDKVNIWFRVHLADSLSIALSCISTLPAAPGCS